MPVKNFFWWEGELRTKLENIFIHCIVCLHGIKKLRCNWRWLIWLKFGLSILAR
jgi:hypothetical protein